MPTESVPNQVIPHLTNRTIILNNVEHPILSVPDNYLADDSSQSCSFLRIVRQKDGDEGATQMGCGLWPLTPLSCSMAPQIAIMARGKSGVTYLKKHGFTRGWQFREHPQCEFHQVGKDTLKRELIGNLAVLRRLEGWAEYLHIPTVIPEVSAILREVADNGVLPTRAITAYDYERPRLF